MFLCSDYRTAVLLWLQAGSGACGEPSRTEEHRADPHGQRCVVLTMVCVVMTVVCIVVTVVCVVVMVVCGCDCGVRLWWCVVVTVVCGCDWCVWL